MHFCNRAELERGEYYVVLVPQDRDSKMVRNFVTPVFAKVAVTGRDDGGRGERGLQGLYDALFRKKQWDIAEALGDTMRYYV